MSNPTEEVDTQQERTEATFADKVNEVLRNAKTDDKGRLVLPEDLSEEVKYAVTAEKRLRDTQAAFTQSRQSQKVLEAEKATLLSKVTGKIELNLTTEQAEELEELKFSDPEAWRNKINKLETAARAKTAQDLEDELKQVSTSSLANEELERRAEILEEFNRANPGFQLTDDIIANDIPPRIVMKLETGKISFEAFLQECYDYSKTGKVVKQEETMDQPNLSKVGGGSKPDKNAVKEDIILSYKKETY